MTKTQSSPKRQPTRRQRMIKKREKLLRWIMKGGAIYHSRTDTVIPANQIVAKAVFENPHEYLIVYETQR